MCIRDRSIPHLHLNLKCQNEDSVYRGSRPPKTKGLYLKLIPLESLARTIRDHRNTVWNYPSLNIKCQNTASVHLRLKPQANTGTDTTLKTKLNAAEAPKRKLTSTWYHLKRHKKIINSFKILKFALTTMKKVLKQAPITFKPTRLHPCVCYVKCQTKRAFDCLNISPISLVHPELNQPSLLFPYRFLYLKGQTKTTGVYFTPIANTDMHSESNKMSNLDLTGVVIRKRPRIISNITSRPDRRFTEPGDLTKRSNLSRSKLYKYKIAKASNFATDRIKYDGTTGDTLITTYSISTTQQLYYLTEVHNAGSPHLGIRPHGRR